MTISVIIPVYNVEKYLSRCLDSILIDNTFENEVICVNDGSTDSSFSILQSYAKQYKNIIVLNQENKGLSEARNTGLMVAKGDYVLFIDSDDWLFPKTLQTVINQIDGEDVIYYNARKICENTGDIDGNQDILERKHQTGQAYLAAICNEPRNIPYVCVWGGLYRRGFLLNNNLWNEPGIYHEDCYFTPLVLLKAKDVSCLNEYVYAYRIRTNGNITGNTKPKHIKDLLFIARHLYNYINKTKDVEPAFYNYIANLYTDLICRAYDNQLPLWKWWSIIDGIHYYKCQGNARTRKSAILSIISPYLSYRYLTDRLPNICRRIVNKYL